ncbi:hypothetical protein ANN_07180 [Periplaneta americana]|uniref:Uncharacterized protein n=1 Tax=Periplaneta americana TaxID=6978 RepID=A0ABQ8TFS7_PERAM|nr:hypothetical protein ANN_07180 [Periplaneta americana]
MEPWGTPLFMIVGYDFIEPISTNCCLALRRCLSEIETLGHVLGACPYGETLRIHRHHAIRTKLADALRKLKYTVYEEVHGTADNGSNRRIDIIAISESLSQSMISDPTIRQEFNQTYTMSVLLFQTVAPGIPLPPQPVLTRWETWLDAVNYYEEHYGKIMEARSKFTFHDALLQTTLKTAKWTYNIDSLLLVWDISVNCPKTGLNLTSDTKKAPVMRQLGQEIMG